jgi:hypothetical protein
MTVKLPETLARTMTPAQRAAYEHAGARLRDEDRDLEAITRLWHVLGRDQQRLVLKLVSAFADDGGAV